MSTLTPIANLLAGIGRFEYKNVAYYVDCPVDNVLGILFSNLRTVVDRMANPATPQAERQAFYHMCPLPFAAWNRPQCPGVRRRVDEPQVDPGFPILLNPGEFMPPDYEIYDFEEDVNCVRNLISLYREKK